MRNHIPKLKPHQLDPFSPEAQNLPPNSQEAVDRDFAIMRLAQAELAQEEERKRTLLGALPSLGAKRNGGPLEEVEDRSKRRRVEIDESVAMEVDEVSSDDDWFAKLLDSLSADESEIEEVMEEGVVFSTPKDPLTEQELAYIQKLGQFIQAEEAKLAAGQSTIRSHQLTALKETYTGLLQGKRNYILPFPTGTGKTYTMVKMAQGLEGRTLIVVPTTNLRTQTMDNFKRFARGMHVKVDSADVTDEDQVVILCNAKFDQMAKDPNFDNWIQQFPFIVFDEAHNVLSARRAENIKHIQEAYHPFMCFATATPEYEETKKRQDKLSAVHELCGFTSMAENPISPYTIGQAIDDKILAPVKNVLVRPNVKGKTLRKILGLSKQRSKSISESDVNFLNTKTLNNSIAEIYANQGDEETGERFLGMQGVVFCSTVNHAEKMASRFNKTIKVDGNPHLEQLRDAYVERMRADHDRRFQERYPGKLVPRFNAEEVRASFSVATALHSGIKTKLLTKELKKKILEDKAYKGKALTAAQLKYVQEKGKLPLTQHLSPEQQEEILYRYEMGGVLMLTGADKLIEGFDSKKARLCMNVRPTRSNILDIQRAGRVLRRDPENPHKIAYILDVDWGIRNQHFFNSYLGSMQRGEMNPRTQYPDPPKTVFDKKDYVNYGSLQWQRSMVFDMPLGRFPSQLANQLNHFVPQTSRQVDVLESCKAILTLLPDLEKTVEGLAGKLEKVRKVRIIPMSMRKKKSTLAIPKHSSSESDSEGGESDNEEVIVEHSEAVQAIINATFEQAKASYSKLDKVLHALEELQKRACEEGESTEEPERLASTQPDRSHASRSKAESMALLLNQLRGLHQKFMTLESGMNGAAPSVRAIRSGPSQNMREDTTGVEEIVQKLHGFISELGQVNQLIGTEKAQQQIIEAAQVQQEEIERRREEAAAREQQRIFEEAARVQAEREAEERARKEAVEEEQRRSEEHVRDQAQKDAEQLHPVLQDLVIAANTGDLQKLRQYAWAGVNVRFSFRNSAGDVIAENTLLHVAAQAGHKEIVQYLIAQGESVDAVNSNGASAAHVAALADKADMLELLTQFNANLNLQDHRGCTPLFAASLSGSRNAVCFLVNQGVDCGLRVRGMTAEEMVRTQFDQNGAESDRLIAEYLEKKRNTNQVDMLDDFILLGERVFGNASEEGFLDELQSLLQVEEMPQVHEEQVEDSRQEALNEQLHVGAREGDLEKVRRAVEAGADIHSNWKKGKERPLCSIHEFGTAGFWQSTALFGACKAGHHSIVDYLVEHGAKVDVQDAYGWSGLHYGRTIELSGDVVHMRGGARLQDFLHIMLTLIAHGVDTEIQTKDGLAPLHTVILYAQNNSVEDPVYATKSYILVKQLLDAGADACAETKQKVTPLHLACRELKKEVIELLLSKDVDINAKTSDGSTPLHDVFQDGIQHFKPELRFEVLELLVDKGADLRAVDSTGATPAMIARKIGWDDMADWLDFKAALKEREGAIPSFSSTSSNWASSITQAANEQINPYKYIDYPIYNNEVMTHGGSSNRSTIKRYCESLYSQRCDALSLNAYERGIVKWQGPAYASVIDNLDFSGGNFSQMIAYKQDFRGTIFIGSISPPYMDASHSIKTPEELCQFMEVLFTPTGISNAFTGNGGVSRDLSMNVMVPLFYTAYAQHLLNGKVQDIRTGKPVEVSRELRTQLAETSRNLEKRAFQFMELCPNSKSVKECRALTSKVMGEARKGPLPIL